MKRKKLTTLLGGVGGPGGGGGGGGGNTGSLVQTMGAFTISATGTEVEDGQLVQTMGPFMGEWSGEAQLFWIETAKDNVLTVKLPAPEDGEYELSAWFTTAAN